MPRTRKKLLLKFSIFEGTLIPDRISLKKDNFSAKDVRKFCEENRSVICGIVIKLLERSPILCKIERFSTVFDPAVFLTLDKPPLQKRLKGLLVSLMDHKI